MKLGDLEDILKILGKYSVDSYVGAAHDVVNIVGPKLKDIFDEEDVKILSEKGCHWTGQYWEIYV
jgi:hypothetical protein